MIPRKDKHWSSVFGPLLQPTESQASSKGLCGDEHKKMFIAMASFRKHQISNEARLLIPVYALEALDHLLMQQAKILMPFVEEFYPDGLRDYPEVVEALTS